MGLWEIIALILVGAIVSHALNRLKLVLSEQAGEILEAYTYGLLFGFFVVRILTDDAAPLYSKGLAAFGAGLVVTAVILRTLQWRAAGASSPPRGSIPASR